MTSIKRNKAKMKTKLRQHKVKKQKQKTRAEKLGKYRSKTAKLSYSYYSVMFPNG